MEDQIRHHNAVYQECSVTPQCSVPPQCSVSGMQADLSSTTREQQDSLCVLQEPIGCHGGSLDSPQVLEEGPQGGLPVARVGQAPHPVAPQVQLMHQQGQVVQPYQCVIP